MIPRVFHRVVPTVVPERFEEYWQALQRLHPGWEFRTWQDPLDPADFELGELFATCGSGAQLAGLVRVEVVWKYGGIYVDMDVEPVRSFDPLRRFEAFVGTEDGRTLTDAVFGAEAGHAGLRALIDRLHQTSMDAGALATGPLLMTAVLTGRSDVKVLAPASFYPAKFDALNRNGADAIETGTYAIHHWHRSWSSPRWTTVATSGVGVRTARAFSRRQLVLRGRLRSEVELVKRRWGTLSPRSTSTNGTYVGTRTSSSRPNTASPCS